MQKILVWIHNFNHKFSGRVYVSKVKEDLSSGEKSNVEDTPTFFIKAIRYEDSYDSDTLLSALKNLINNNSNNY